MTLAQTLLHKRLHAICGQSIHLWQETYAFGQCMAGNPMEVLEVVNPHLLAVWSNVRVNRPLFAAYATRVG